MEQKTYYKNGKTATVNISQEKYYLDAGWGVDAPKTEAKSSAGTPTPTLIDIASKRPDVLGTAEKQGGDPYTKGTKANTWLNDWYNRTGKAEGADMASKGVFDKPEADGKTERSIMDIASSRPDVLTEAKRQGGDPYRAGTAANTWLNDWWNTTGKKEFPDVTLSEHKITRSLINIANSRPDVLETARAQGGDPFKIGTAANTWLNDWWNSAGKYEFPNVILGEPKDEQTQFTEDANKIQEELFDNLPSGDDLNISDSQKILDEIIAKFESGEGLPEKPPSMAELFAETKAELGMEPLEEDLARIDSEIDTINSELLIQQGQLTGGQELITSGQLSRRKGTLQKEAEDRILRLNIEKGIVTRQLNNKISSLEMIMQFSQQDYENSTAYYKANFDRSVKMYELLSGAEDREMEIEEKAEQDAKANWTVVYNSIKDGLIDYSGLTVDQKIQIKSLETQAGLPTGFMEMTMSKDPEGKIQTVTSRTDGSGNTYFDVLKLAPDGTMTVDSIFKGKAKVSTGGYTPTTTKKEWLERGGLEGTGLTLNEYFDKKEENSGGGPTEGEQLQQMKDTIFEQLESEAGLDGHVSNEFWNFAREKWIRETKYDGNKFDALFSEDFVNPEHAHLYKGMDTY